jgi:hypothetical protein
MLAVLFVMGMATAIVAPRIPTMMDRLDFALKRQTLEQTLSTLSYQAFRDNQAIVLAGTYDHTGRLKDDDEEPASAGDRDLAPAALASAPLVDLPPIAPVTARLPLPSGWKLTAAQPIYIEASGYCRGGSVEVRVGLLTYAYNLKPPLCAASLAE